MKQINIGLDSRSYNILIGGGLLDRAGELVAGLFPGGKALLVTNPDIGALYAGRLTVALESAGITVIIAEVPEGEQYKSLAVAGELYDRAFGAGLDRGCPVLALGGGVVGDLAGFIAATYMRGVPFIQVPTTLLAHVDSSVGGKVAVNHPRGKNIIGAFYQPVMVISDIETLSTLDSREIRSGLAEVIKYGIIGDAPFFNWLEEHLDSVLALEPVALAHVIEQSCLNKARVVEQDETEQGTRALLNLGHTAGHALEALSGYGQYRHGEAVAIGMAVAARIAVDQGLLTPIEEQRITALLQRTGLPVKVPPKPATEDLIKSMYGDKKTAGGKITVILPETIGRASIRKNMPSAPIATAIDSLRN